MVSVHVWCSATKQVILGPKVDAKAALVDAKATCEQILNAVAPRAAEGTDLVRSPSGTPSRSRVLRPHASSPCFGRLARNGKLATLWCLCASLSPTLSVMRLLCSAMPLAPAFKPLFEAAAQNGSSSATVLPQPSCR